MRVLIFGARGMLGHKLYQHFQTHFDVFATVRSGFEAVERFGIFDRESIIENIDVTDHGKVQRAIDISMPDVVINAAGVIKQVAEANDPVISLSVNSLVPRQLARLASKHSFRLITMSTDCVFSGVKGSYTEDDEPDARDLYGMSKLLGEVDVDGCLCLRTSMIGRELGTSHSFVEWFLSNRGQKVGGFSNAIFSGFPTCVLADLLRRIISDHPTLHGIHHLSSNPISKFALLQLLNEHFNADVEIEPDARYRIDRSLDSTRFRIATGIATRPWPEMISQMATDDTPYDTFR